MERFQQIRDESQESALDGPSQPTQSCALFKKLADKFTPPLIKRQSELKNAVNAGKFRIEFKDESKKDDDGTTTPKPTDKKDDDKEKQPLVLNFNSLSFSPNEKLFPVEKQSGVFEMVAAHRKIRPDYAFEESSSENTSLRTLNDCYLHCLNSNTDQVVCHSFAFCLDPVKSLANCQLSSLYFEESMEANGPAALIEADKPSTPSDSGKDTGYTKYLEEASSCTTFNLMFGNYFRPINDRKMEAHFSFITLDDYTLEGCLEQCHFHAKSKETITDDTMCRLVEHCIVEESVDENGMQKRSTCMMSKENAPVLRTKDPEERTNCQLYDCK